MSELSPTPVARITVRALSLGDRIETTGLESKDVLSAVPLVFRAGENGTVALFRYRVAVLIGMSALEEEGIIAQLDGRILSPMKTQEEQMPQSTDVTPRRGFFSRIACMSAFGLSGLATTTVRAQTSQSDGLDWPGTLKGRHKQLFDVYDINAGSPLGFANNFLSPNESATAVLVFRHKGTPYALGSTIWEKYKIGESFHIIDPETKAPAVKNPWFQPKPGVLGNGEASIDRLYAKGTVMGVCSVSLRAQSRRLAANAGVSPEEALKEWTAGLIPGASVIPSGTWGVNRAQEAGCTYCAGG